jgi:Flp pilus assembly protein TadD
MDLRIDCRNLAMAPRWRTSVGRYIEKLQNSYGDLTHARVTLEKNLHHKKGRVATVQVVLSVRGATITAHKTDKTFEQAITAAFLAAGRELKSYREKRKSTEIGLPKEAIMKSILAFTMAGLLLGAAACTGKSSESPMSAADAPLAAPGGAAGDVATAISNGNSHYAQGHHDVAAGHYEKALTADPNSAEAHFNLALALDQMGHHEEAAVHFEEANRLGANNPAITGSEILKKHIGG